MYITEPVTPDGVSARIVRGLSGKTAINGLTWLLMHAIPVQGVFHETSTISAHQGLHGLNDNYQPARKDIQAGVTPWTSASILILLDDPGTEARQRLRC